MRKQWVAAIQRTLRRSRREAVVSRNQTWQAIADEYGIGVVVGRGQLRFNAKDLERLHAALRQHLKTENPLSVDFSAERVELSAHSLQEKHSTRLAFSMARIASTDGAVMVTDLATKQSLKLPVPTGTLLSVQVELLDLTSEPFSNIILVENGAAIENWWRITPLLPEELRTNSLFVYRGHDSAQEKLLEKLASLSLEQTKVFVFGDYDPSGIFIALSSVAARMTEKPVWFIAPASLCSITAEMSKDSEFVKQRGNLEWVQKQSSLAKPAIKLVNHLADNCYAVTQEVLIARGVSLSAYQLVN